MIKLSIGRKKSNDRHNLRSSYIVNYSEYNVRLLFLFQWLNFCVWKNVIFLLYESLNTRSSFDCHKPVHNVNKLCMALWQCNKKKKKYNKFREAENNPSISLNETLNYNYLMTANKWTLNEITYNNNRKTNICVQSLQCACGRLSSIQCFRLLFGFFDWILMNV